jgi:hypothetical protein
MASRQDGSPTGARVLRRYFGIVAQMVFKIESLAGHGYWDSSNKSIIYFRLTRFRRSRRCYFADVPLRVRELDAAGERSSFAAQVFTSF